MKLSTTYNFTDRRVKSISADVKTRTYSDRALSNLKLTVTVNGTKTCYVRFKVNNQTINYRIGSVGAI